MPSMSAFGSLQRTSTVSSSSATASSMNMTFEL